MVDNSLLNGYLFTESLQWILSLKLLELNRSVLIQEFIDRKETSTNSDLDVVLLNFDGNSLRSKLINTFALSHEHDLELGSLWVVVDELSKFLICGVSLDWNIHSDSLLEVNDVLLKSLDFNFGIFELFQEFKRSLVSFINFLLKFKNVIRTVKNFLLECSFLINMLFDEALSSLM